MDYDPFIKSQLALDNQLEGLISSKFGHVTPRMWYLEAVGELADGALDVQVRQVEHAPVLVHLHSERESPLLTTYCSESTLSSR